MCGKIQTALGSVLLLLWQLSLEQRVFSKQTGLCGTITCGKDVTKSNEGARAPGYVLKENLRLCVLILDTLNHHGIKYSV